MPPSAVTSEVDRWPIAVCWTGSVSEPTVIQNHTNKDGEAMKEVQLRYPAHVIAISEFKHQIELRKPSSWPASAEITTKTPSCTSSN